VIRTPLLLGMVITLAAAAAIVFIGVAVTELNYAADHPYAYGPARVIAWGAGAGAALSVALGLLAVMMRPSSAD
jgi:acetyl esterase/lipase